MYKTCRIDAPENIFRASPRPKEKQNNYYSAEFDDRTLIYDVSSPEKGIVIATAPPLMNFRHLLDGISIGNVKLSDAEIIERDRCCDIVVNTDAQELVIDWRGSARLLDLDLNHIFEGKRVVYTLSKNNQVSWISNWIRLNIFCHNADAFLIYDNNSTIYTAEALQEELRKDFPSVTILVFSWPYKYGPQRSLDSAWDSDFCQHGAFHSARFRFLQRASSVLNSDIDELVVSPDGMSIFKATESSKDGYIPFPGRWVVPADKRSDRHRDSIFLETEPNNSPWKWCAVPARNPISSQWCTHTITHIAPVPTEFEYRHFRFVSNHWKGNRASASGEIGQVDNILVSIFKKIDEIFGYN